MTQVSSATSAPAGARKTHGNVVAVRCPSAMRVPSDVAGGCTPKPKKDSEDSASTAPATARVASTTRSEDRLGRMCRVMIRRAGTFMYRAAVT